MPDLKFCGLTRPEDAAAAASLGAGYLGVIFAGGPRLVDAERAALVLRAARSTARRVGVFGSQAPSEIGQITRAAGLDVVQLHADPSPDDIAAVRAESSAEIWAVVRVGSELPDGLDELFDVAEAVVLDARVAGTLGGSGRALDWGGLAEAVARVRRGRALVLAGGLRPNNVGEAIAALAPDVVDVSSGVESAPGIKDHALMRAFQTAVASATATRGR